MGILRASGFNGALKMEQLTGAILAAYQPDPASFEVVPERCGAATGTVSMAVWSPAGREFAYFTYRD